VQNAYFRTANAIDRELETRFKIGFSEFEILDLLSEVDAESCRMKDLTKQTPMTQSALSRIIDRLEKAGLVRRQVCSDDRRAMYVELTEKGSKLHHEAAVAHRAVLEEFLQT
jgi:DNA-binding MarR family transcriptional regulator